jgi:hypothetical protein
MEERRGRFFGPALVLALGAVGCTAILASSMIRIRTSEEIIRVVGSARKPIRSDLIIWRGRVTRNSPDVALAYTALKNDMDKATHYLVAKGIPAAEISPTAINIRTLYVKTKNDPEYESSESNEGTFRQVAGYELSQNVEVRSTKVDTVERISRESTELLSQGVKFASQPPMYIFTKLSDLKVTMQAEAARDAYARASQIATNSGCRLGRVRYARMSTPQLTPLYSSAESDGGVDDTTSLDKKITAVVTAGYAIR